MTQIEAVQAYLKDIKGNYIVPYVNPASSYVRGVVKPDMQTLSVDSNGTLSVIVEHANQDLGNLTQFGNARLQYAPFSINSGTVANGRNQTLRYNMYIQEYTQPGTYSLEITESGNYEIEMYGAGGGWANTAWVTDTWYHNTSSGGSGAGFKGVVTLAQGSYTVTVGAGGASVNGGFSAATGGNGGSTRLNNLIITGGGTGAHSQVGSVVVGQGGSVTIGSSVTVISTSLNSSGRNGTYAGNAYSFGPSVVQGGSSLYDNTQTGFGAGGGYPNNAVNGYFKITKISGGDSSYFTCDPCTLTTARGETVAINTSRSMNVSNVSNGTFYIFRSVITEDLRLSAFKILPFKPGFTGAGPSWLDTSQSPARLMINIKNSETGEIEFQERDQWVWIGIIEVLEGGVANLINREFNASPQYRYGVYGATAGAAWYEVYSDGWCEQGGQCTSGTSIQLSKAFADTNYTLTVPFSAKTASSFTPSQDGYWFACGYLKDYSYVYRNDWE